MGRAWPGQYAGRLLRFDPGAYRRDGEGGRGPGAAAHSRGAGAHAPGRAGAVYDGGLAPLPLAGGARGGPGPSGAARILTIPPPSPSRTREGSEMRSAERRDGKVGVSTCRYRWSPYHKKKKSK